MRLDLFLRDKFADQSRSALQKLIEAGSVLLNNKKVPKKTILNYGDVITIDWPEIDHKILPDKSIPLTKIHEDDDILVINKPANLVVHPGAGTADGTLINALLYYDFKSFSAMLDDELRPGIVHRLDKDTSGVMVVTKNEAAKLSLINEFKQGNTTKEYLALVRGTSDIKSGTIDTLIGRSPTNRKKMAVVHKNGKRAITSYRIIAQANDYSLVKLQIKTGRTHQIRVHLAHINLPVAGDTVYGKRRKDEIDFPRQMLHAFTLKFRHPKSGQVNTFQAEISTDFHESAEKVGIDISDDKIKKIL